MPQTMDETATHDDPGNDAMDEASLLRQARSRFDEAWDHDRVQRDKAMHDFKFVAGEQWDDVSLKSRDRSKRPTLTINRLKQFVRQVLGDLRQNRMAVRVLPVEQGDQDTAKVLQGLIRHIEGTSNAHAAKMTAASHAVIGGIGHFRVLTDYVRHDTLEQCIKIGRITNPFAVVWDPQAVELDRSDARYCFVTSLLTEEDFKARFPGKLVVSHDEGSAGDTRYWSQNDLIRVAEYWRVTTRPGRVYQLADGRTQLVEDGGAAPPDEIVARRRDGRMAVRDTEIPVVDVTLLSGSSVLEETQVWPGRHIPIIPVLGEEIDIGERTERAGLVRDAKDAQRMYNVARSAQVEQVWLQPKSPWLVTARQIAGHEARWANANNTLSPYLVYSPDPNAPPPQRLPQPQASQGMSQEIAMAAEDMKATTGIYDASLGNRSNESSGIAIRARQRESDVGSFHFSDNLQLAIRRMGQIMVDLIPHIYDTPRQLRILGEDNETDVAEADFSGTDPGAYDVVVQSGPAYSTLRAEAADMMTSLLQGNPQLMQMAGDLMIGNYDWPNSDVLAKRLKRLVPTELLDPEDDADMLQERQMMAAGQQRGPSPAEMLALAKGEADVMKARADAERSEAAAAKDRAQAEKIDADTLLALQELEENMGAIVSAYEKGVMDQARAKQFLDMLMAQAPPAAQTMVQGRLAQPGAALRPPMSPQQSPPMSGPFAV